MAFNTARFPLPNFGFADNSPCWFSANLRAARLDMVVTAEGPKICNTL